MEFSECYTGYIIIDNSSHTSIHPTLPWIFIRQSVVLTALCIFPSFITECRDELFI